MHEDSAAPAQMHLRQDMICTGSVSEEHRLHLVLMKDCEIGRTGGEGRGFSEDMETLLKEASEEEDRSEAEE